MSCSGYKINKYSYEYCNNGFTLHGGCKIKGEVSDKFKPPCVREESCMSILPRGFDILKYRDKKKKYKS